MLKVLMSLSTRPHMTHCMGCRCATPSCTASVMVLGASHLNCLMRCCRSCPLLQ